MITYLAIFQPIDLFDPSTEMILVYLFVLALGLIGLKIFLRRKYHRLVDTLPVEEQIKSQDTTL